MAYYTLVTKERRDQPFWAIQFGDHDRAVVEQERRDSYARQPFKIVRTNTSRQSEVEAAVAALAERG